MLDDIIAAKASSTSHASDATNRTGSSGDSLVSDFLPLKFMKAAQGIQLAFTRQLSTDFDIGIAEWRLLSALHEEQDIAANEVAAIAGMDKVQVSRAVSRALGHELVSRRRDQDDRRRTVLNLTDKGREVVKASEPVAKRFDEELRTKLGKDSHEQLENQLRELIKIADDLLKR